MTLRAQIVFWLSLLAALLFGIWLLGPVMTPFIAGMVLAYFLDPVADALERAGLPRLAATTIIFVVAIAAFLLLFLLLAPLVVEQFSQFVDNLPRHLAALARLIDENAPQWLKDALARTTARGELDTGQLAAKASGWLTAVLTSIWNGTTALLNVVSLLIITPIVLFYMLNDWDRMVAVVDSWLPRQHAETIRAIARDIDKAMAGFIRGQGTVCLLLGSMYAAALVVVGLKFGLLIGLIAGFLSFIPYVGSTIGAVLSIGMALVQFWPDWHMVLLIAFIFAAGQFIEGNFLTPKLVGGSVGLHPVWMMFALMAFGYLFGFVGLLLAVPLAAAVRIVAVHALRQYQNSAFYLGADGVAVARHESGSPKNGEAD